MAQAGEPIPLRAGPVTAEFDADNVFLRYIRVGQHEVLLNEKQVLSSQLLHLICGTKVAHSGVVSIPDF